jgi:serine/threonine protein kinase
MSKLLSQGGFGCVYYPGIACDGTKDPRKTIVTKLQKRDFNADNEVIIGDMIKEIPSYRSYYLPVIDSCPVNIRKIDNELISDCRVVAKSQNVPFVLMSVPYVSNRGFFNALTDPSLGRKQVISTLARTYGYLLSAIKKLLGIGVVHFDLKGDNILYNLVTKDPQIIDFGISLPLERLTRETWRNYFYAYAPEYHVWPLEVHLISFLLHESSTLNDVDVSVIVRQYTKGNKTLGILSIESRAKYIKQCEVCLKRYVNRPMEDVIPELIAQYKTWDNYGLSVMYIKALTHLFPRGVHKNKILSQFTQLLLLNISPEFSTRISIEDTQQRFEKIFFSGGHLGEYEKLVDEKYDSVLKTDK